MNTRLAIRILILLHCLVLASACSHSSASVSSKRYHLEGTVISIEKAQHQVTIDHKDIPGFMDAMTMPYRVPDDRVLNALKAGDSITATVVVSGDQTWLEDVRVIQHSSLAERLD